ncbi:U3 small nucleolar RNA-associated protein 15 domain-containing protein [Paramicrosporidium saccamoebae]|uniref:U3 small nucleolar RNA-associated protein 15 domain-containing protein n=1 Tax=Paramicrosporidium saccamoebae TaxID=1246581 RepID=A0A2H9TFZ2_9FUNG|nr:U3 small nucleolar RNA-associated protein 15 domain-containing protein [Paramicrosporidium saccamoebae]
MCKLDDNVQSIAFRSDGRLLAVGSSKGDILIIDATTRMVLRTLEGHRASVKGLSFLPNKTHVVSTSDDKTVRLWEISSGTEIWSSSINKDFVRCCSVSNTFEDESFITGSYDHTLTLWSVKSPEPLLIMNHGSPVEAVCLFPDGKTAVSGGLCSIKFWDLSDNGRLIREVIVHHKSITGLSVTPDGKYLLSSSLDRSLKVLCLEDMTISHQFKFPSSVMCMSMSSDLKRVAAGLSNGKTIVLAFTTEQKGRVEGISPNPRNANVALAANESYVITKETTEPLKKFDLLLKSFRYRKALDFVIQKGNATLLVSAIGELIRRDALDMALSGRTEAELIPLVETICRHISNPRHSSFLLEAAFSLTDIYSSVLGKSKAFDGCIKDLRQALDYQICVQQMMMDLQGGLALVQAACQINHTRS